LPVVFYIILFILSIVSNNTIYTISHIIIYTFHYVRSKIRDSDVTLHVRCDYI
jgi:hypothetical protein